MDFSRAQDLIQELDELVPRAGAAVALQQGAHPHESALIANQTGDLRLGIELMRAGCSAPRPP
jgi:hypothetical protein